MKKHTLKTMNMVELIQPATITSIALFTRLKAYSTTSPKPKPLQINSVPTKVVSHWQKLRRRPPEIADLAIATLRLKRG